MASGGASSVFFSGLESEFPTNIPPAITTDKQASPRPIATTTYDVGLSQPGVEESWMPLIFLLLNSCCLRQTGGFNNTPDQYLYQSDR
mgnify:CR=1 FL=1